MTSGSMQNYYNDVVNDDANKNDSGNYRINNKITISKSFEYKTKITGSTPVDNGRLDTNWTTSGDFFWFTFNQLWNRADLSWSKNCVISEMSRIPDLLASSTANPPNNRVALTQTNG